MGRTKKKCCERRAARKQERELQQRLVALGLESPPTSPTRLVLRPDKAIRAGQKYEEEPNYRKLLDFLVRSVLSEFGLMDYTKPSADELSLGDHFPLEEFIKVFKITYMQADLWFPFWKPFFRANWEMSLNREDYLDYLSKGLWCIYHRERPFFDNLLAAHSFVFSATVYYSYNGWYEATLHPLRVLASYYEGKLRNPFARAGGFRGLARFCANHDMLKMYEYYCERKITREYQALEKDIKVRVRKEVDYIVGKFDKLLSENPEHMTREVALLGTLAWVHYTDLDFKKKRIIGNEWKFKDHLMLSEFLLRKSKPHQERLRQRDETTQEDDDDDDCSDLRRPLVSQTTLRIMGSFLVEFNKNIFELEKRVESLLD